MAEYRVVKPASWRLADDSVELWDPAHERTVKLAPWTDAVLAAIHKEAPVAELATLVRAREGRRKESRATARAKRLVFALAQMGHLEIFADPPAPEIDGRYRFVRELGRGGVGIAYLYRDTARDVNVVVKRAWDFMQPYEVTEEAMRREVRVLAQLDHPGIVRGLGSFEVNGHVHVIREFLDGQDLSAAVGSGWTDASRRRAVARAIAGILAHMHERGYLMLDMRPANFFLRGSDDPVLIDVGQCRAFDGARLQFKRRIGSPGFTSPEMESAKTVDARSDVWGFGRLMLFLGIGPAAHTEPIDALLARAPVEDREILAQLLAPSPDARPPTMQDALRLVSA